MTPTPEQVQRARDEAEEWISFLFGNEWEWIGTGRSGVGGAQWRICFDKAAFADRISERIAQALADEAERVREWTIQQFSLLCGGHMGNKFLAEVLAEIRKRGQRKEQP